MNLPTSRTALACLTAAQFLLFSATAAATADEPQAVEGTATLRLDGLKLNLREAEAEPQAGLIFALDTATEAQPHFWLGLSLANPDDALRLHLGIAANTALIVTGIEIESPAAKAGVMVNDLLLKLDGKPVATVEALAAQIQEIGEKSVPLELLRRGKPATLTVTPEKRGGECLVVQLENLELIPGIKVATEPLAFGLKLAGDAIVVEAAGDDLAKRVAELQEQVKVLQKAIDSLESAIKAKSAADGGGK